MMAMMHQMAAQLISAANVAAIASDNAAAANAAANAATAALAAALRTTHLVRDQVQSSTLMLGQDLTAS